MDDQQLEARLDTLAGVIDSLFEGKGPDLLGLAEIETESILANLEQRLRSRYLRLFEPGPGGCPFWPGSICSWRSTGLMPTVRGLVRCRAT
jgi:hypothetical protein